MIELDLSLRRICGDEAVGGDIAHTTVMHVFQFTIPRLAWSERNACYDECIIQRL